MQKPLFKLSALAAVALGLAACGGSDKPAEQSGSQPATTQGVASTVPDVAVSSLPPSAPPVRGTAPAQAVVASTTPRAVAPAPVRTTPAAPSLSQQVVGAVMVQVASFSSRDNAQKALERLLAADSESSLPPAGEAD